MTQGYGNVTSKHGSREPFNGFCTPSLQRFNRSDRFPRKNLGNSKHLSKDKLKKLLFMQILKQERAILRSVGEITQVKEYHKAQLLTKKCPMCEGDAPDCLKLEQKIGDLTKNLRDSDANQIRSDCLLKLEKISCIDMKFLAKLQDSLLLDAKFDNSNLEWKGGKENSLKQKGKDQEIIEGRKVGLRSMKRDVLQNKKCGICETDLGFENLHKFLVNADRQLAHFHRSMSV